MVILVKGYEEIVFGSGKTVKVKQREVVTVKKGEVVMVKSGKVIMVKAR